MTSTNRGKDITMLDKEKIEKDYVAPIIVAVLSATIMSVGSSIFAKAKGVTDWHLLIIIALAIAVGVLLGMAIFFAVRNTRFSRMGLIGIYENRKNAFKIFERYLKRERETEIVVIARCMYGLLISCDIKDAIEHKIENRKNKIKFLLTHPAYADISVGPHGDDNPHHYASLVCDALTQLSEWEIPHTEVKLYKGAPTIFAIKTNNYMLVTPYPYGANAHNSPSLILHKVSGQSGLYDCYADTHFAVLVGTNPCVVKIDKDNYDAEIEKHDRLKPIYGDLAKSLFHADQPVAFSKK